MLISVKWLAQILIVIMLTKQFGENCHHKNIESHSGNMEYLSIYLNLWCHPSMFCRFLNTALYMLLHWYLSISLFCAIANSTFWNFKFWLFILVYGKATVFCILMLYSVILLLFPRPFSTDPLGIYIHSCHLQIKFYFFLSSLIFPSYFIVLARAFSMKW